ncbi:MAG: histidine kinase [Rhodothermaceae bacterium]|nr:histidine kinase [Rhodothermaceae bacterium]
METKKLSRIARNIKPGSVQDLIPFASLFRLLLGIAVSVQLVIITFNHFSGYYTIEGTSDFITRLLNGSVLSLIAAFLLAWPDLVIIKRLNSTLPWDRHPLMRIIVQIPLAAFLAVLVSTLITLLSDFIGGYPEGLMPVLVKNAIIFAVCNIMLMMILEAWIFYAEGSLSRQRAEELERELSQIRFEVLKNQINPHFMFNSLNVLSGLIGRDTDKAQRFIEEFSSIYRYVLETIEQPVVTVNREIDFARSYMFLQQIRYGENLIFTVDLPAEVLDGYLPPISLQIVLENAIKHNLVSPGQPLRIDVTHGPGSLVICNNVQLKISSGVNTGLGQKNLLKRYALISERVPEFRMGATHYQVILPLIQGEV